jgi:hypothetical protein
MRTPLSPVMCASEASREGATQTGDDRIRAADDLKRAAAATRDLIGLCERIAANPEVLAEGLTGPSSAAEFLEEALFQIQASFGPFAL